MTSFTIVHTFTAPIYGGQTSLEISGIRTFEGAIVAAEARCLDFGGSYVIVEQAA